MPEKLEFTIKPLTPIFTGGTEGKCDRLHETGLIGSLRWWFEVLVRGMGGYACDPTQKSERVSDKRSNHYCDACAVFGTTGLKRAFSFKIEHCANRDHNRQLSAIRVKDEYYVNIKGKPVSKNHRGWFLQPGVTSDLKGVIHYPLRSLPYGLNNEHLKQIIILTFNLASRWGGLGAGTSKGFGVCNWVSSSNFDFNSAYEGLIKLINKDNPLDGVNTNLPRLNEFFFTKVQFHPEKPEYFLTGPAPEMERIFSPSSPRQLTYYTSKNIIPISPLVRYYLRQLIRDTFPGNKNLRHRLMGEVQEQGRQKSLINVSHAYAVPGGKNNYEFRIWGWIPQNSQKSCEGVPRKTIIDLLQQWTAPGGELWKSCNLVPDSSYNRWFDMSTGNIETNIRGLITVKGGENK